MFPAPPGGKEIPFELVDKAPEIPEHLMLHWDCFTQCLGSADGGRITIGEVLAYCQLYRIEDEGTRDELLRLCRYLSDEWRVILEKRIAARQKAQVKSGKRGVGNSRRPWAQPRGR